MTTAIIRVNDIAKKFTINKDKSLKERLVNMGRSKKHVQEFWALKGVSFELEASKTLGLIGANGSGKSTLLAVIGGILSPDTGYVERRGRLAALLELGAGFHGDLTGRENVYLNASILGLTRRQTEAYFDAIVDFSGIEQFIDTQVKFYSSGMAVRLAFAVAIHVDPDILLVDEVLAVGDEPFQRKCMERIKQFQREGRTIVFVTHGLDQVRQLCDRVIMLEHGRMVVDGTPVDALRAFRERYNIQAGQEPEHGDRRLEIIKTIVTDGDGRPKDRFVPGDSLGIELEVLAHEPTEDWVAGIAVTNHLDLLVYGTNTNLQRIELAPLEGRRRLRFRFDSIPMVEGQYYVTVAVHPRVGPEYHRLDRVVSFKVYSDAVDDGVLHLAPRFEVVE
ncbi:MAG TPA: ABC transporter ATP-binding protein [Actinomycetes bacterium]|nr:ABC transporter ATP-binding protein [Actinomycetes bacterium]